MSEYSASNFAAASAAPCSANLYAEIEMTSFQRDGKTSPPVRESSGAALPLSSNRFGEMGRTRSPATKIFQTLIGLRPTVGLVVDYSGTVETVRIFNTRPLEPACGALIGRKIQDLTGTAAYRTLATALDRSQRDDRAQEVGCLFETGRGPRWFSVSVRRVPAPRDGQRKFSIFVRDATDRSTSPDELSTAESLLLHAERTAQIAIWSADLNQSALAFSPQLLAILGLTDSRSSVPSQLLWSVVQSCRAAGQNSPDSCDSGPIEVEIPYGHPDGSERVFQVVALPATYPAKDALQFSGILRDITERKAAERKLSESQALLAQAEQIANLGSWQFDVATRSVKWSEQLSNLLGRRAGDAANEQIYWDNLHPGDRVRVREIFEDAVERCGEFTHVARYRLPSGEYRVHCTSGAPIPNAGGKSARFIGVVQDITEQTRVEENLRCLSRELMRARDEERRHMARELHESAGQTLAALKMTLGNLRHALPKSNSLANSLLQTCVELTNETVKEVRTISYLMHPPMLDEAGLPSAIHWYARGFAERSGVQVQLDVPEDFGRIAQEIEMTAFRVVQEALTNVHRYSGSKTAEIRLARYVNEIRLEIQDHGCGLSHPTQTAGVGVAGMRERVQQLRGTFEIETVPGGGTTVRVALPVKEPSERLMEDASEDVEQNSISSPQGDSSGFDGGSHACACNQVIQDSGSR